MKDAPLCCGWEVESDCTTQKKWFRYEDNALIELERQSCREVILSLHLVSCPLTAGNTLPYPCRERHSMISMACLQLMTSILSPKGVVCRSLWCYTHIFACTHMLEDYTSSLLFYLHCRLPFCRSISWMLCPDLMFVQTASFDLLDILRVLCWVESEMGEQWIGTQLIFAHRPFAIWVALKSDLYLLVLAPT